MSTYSLGSSAESKGLEPLHNIHKKLGLPKLPSLLTNENATDPIKILAKLTRSSGINPSRNPLFSMINVKSRTENIIAIGEAELEVLKRHSIFPYALLFLLFFNYARYINPTHTIYIS